MSVVAAQGSAIAAAADLYGTDTAETAIRAGTPSHRVVTIEADAPPAGVVQVNGSDASPDALKHLLAPVADKILSTLRRPSRLPCGPAVTAMNTAVGGRREREHRKIPFDIRYIAGAL